VKQVITAQNVVDRMAAGDQLTLVLMTTPHKQRMALYSLSAEYWKFQDGSRVTRSVVAMLRKQGFLKCVRQGDLMVANLIEGYGEKRVSYAIDKRERFV
jgi:hypothetical protein